jgi:O-antigen/teichoic acid export membrane protein
MADEFGAKNYGKYIIYKSMTHQGLVAILAFGINVTLRREFGKFQTKKISILDLKIVSQLIIITLPLILIISFLLPNEFLLSISVIILFLTIETTLVYLNSILEGLKRVTLIRILDIFQIFTVLTAIILLNYGIFYCVLIIFIFNCVRLVIYILSIVNLSARRLELSWTDIRQSAKFLSVSNVLSVLNNNFEKYVVALLAGIELIIYLDIIQKFSKIFKNQIGVFTTIIQPYYQASSNSFGESTFIKKMQEAFLFLSVMLSLSSFFYCPWLMKIWMGSDYVFLSEYINYMIMGVNLYLINSLVGMKLILNHNYVGTLRIQAIVTISRIILTLALFPLIGLWAFVINLYVLVAVFWLGDLNNQRIPLLRYQLIFILFFMLLDYIFFTEINEYNILYPDDTLVLFISLFSLCIIATISFFKKANRLIMK